MAMVATGLVLARLLGDGGNDGLNVAAGVALIVVGALLAVLSYRVYRRNDVAIRTQSALERSSLPLVLLIVIGAASVVAIVLSLT